MTHRNLFDTFGGGTDVAGKDDTSSSDNDSDYVQPMETESSSSELSEAPDDDPMEEESLLVSKDGTEWTLIPPSRARARARNIIKGPVSKVVYADHVIDKTTMFKLFITDDIVNQIVLHTNSYGRSNNATWVDTDSIEVRALIGVLIIAGMMKQNMVDMDVIWSNDYGIHKIRQCMSRNRFKSLMAALRFDEKTTRNQRKVRDKMAAIHDIWDEWQLCLKRYYIPGPNLTVDEQLMPFRGRCSFIQYLPSKPDRYGIKMFWIVDSDNSYPLRCVPYLGKEERSPHIGLGREVVLKLSEPFNHSSRNITADNYFCDLALAKQLLGNGLTLVGTIKSNKRFIPSSFVANTELYSSDFAFLKEVMLVSYQSKKKKKVHLLSTMHHLGNVGDDKKKKPEVVTYYNETKAGVDTLDQMTHAYTTKRKTKRWPVVMFFNMLDISGIAAFILWNICFPSGPEGGRRADRWAA